MKLVDSEQTESKGYSKMKNLWLIALLALSLFDCGHIVDEQGAVWSSDFIKGDWVVTHLENTGWQNSATFSFQDSLASYPFSYDEFTRYEIRSDTLIIEKGTDILEYTDIPHNGSYQFRILKLNNEELQLQPLTPLSEELFKFSKRIQVSTIEAKRLIPKNDQKFERIAFYSSLCYGRCPSMYLEIDAKGNIWFEGRHYTQNDGQFRGKIPSAELLAIERKIRNIDFQNLEKDYSVSWSDQQTCSIKIKTNDKEFVSRVYGSFEEPVALRLLMDKLMGVYKLTDLTSDSTAAEGFRFAGFEYNLVD